MIRLYSKSKNEFILNTNTVESVLDNPLILSMEDDLEAYIYFPNRMVRIVDIETLSRAKRYIVSYLETSYYSGAEDGSFTIEDARSLEEKFPALYMVPDDPDKMFNDIDEYMSKVRLVSADHAVIDSPIKLIDTLLFLKERPMYLYTREPQRDSLEFLISHIMLVDRTTMRIYKAGSIDTLFSIIFSKAILEEMDVVDDANNSI